jgi:selenocysteine lyase/cysteine desulfurase
VARALHSFRTLPPLSVRGGRPIIAARECLERARVEGFDARRLAACTGRPAGAVRVSPGLATSAEDVDRALDMLSRWCDSTVA